MATRYVTLKDSNGDILYPQISSDSIGSSAITTSKIANSAVTTAKIANSAVTAAKIEPSVLEYQPGDSVVIGDYSSGLYWTGRQRKTSTVKAIWSSIVLPKPVSSNVTNMTFTPHATAYNECFSPNGTIYSIVNPTSSQLTFSLSKPSGGQTNMVKVVVNVVDTSWQNNMTANQMCSLNIQGTLTFS